MAGEGGNFDLGSFSMSNNVEFQMVCGDCGSLAIKIENPVSASRETIVAAVISALHEGPRAR
jgi:hypothetical protein